MFRIRRIFDDVLPANQHTLEQVKAIMRSYFEVLARKKIDRIPESLRFPFKYGFPSILYMAEDHRFAIRGLALLEGYNNRSIGTNARSFFTGLLSGRGRQLPQRKEKKRVPAKEHI